MGLRKSGGFLKGNRLIPSCLRLKLLGSSSFSEKIEFFEKSMSIRCLREANVYFYLHIYGLDEKSADRHDPSNRAGLEGF
ncbi:MAG: hypothetical protein ACO3A2_11420 [Bdellovibrionia bacterium]